MASIILVSRFKNERHILFEWVHHHFEEGIDKILLIDHRSDDDYLAHNDWMQRYIENGKIEIVQSRSDDQRLEYDNFLEQIRVHDWMIQIDLDEFVFCPQISRSLKQILVEQYRHTDYIQVHWKMFAHQAVMQPKSVIESNLITHEENVDPTSRAGVKCLAKTRFLESVKIHICSFNKQLRSVRLHSHNCDIQINHYRTQSDELLYGVKEQRGGGDGKKDILEIEKKLNLHASFSRKDTHLLDKRRDLVSSCNNRPQVKPMIYPNSHWSLHIQKNKKH